MSERGRPQHRAGKKARRGPRHAASKVSPAPPKKTTARGEASEHHRRLARPLRPLLIAVVVIAVLFVGVFPTRTYLAQRAAIARAEEQVDVLTAENDRLDDRIDALNSHDEIERIAREDFELVRPGERPYVVVPPAEAPVDLPTAWPFGGLADEFEDDGAD